MSRRPTSRSILAAAAAVLVLSGVGCGREGQPTSRESAGGTPAADTAPAAEAPTPPAEPSPAAPESAGRSAASAENGGTEYQMAPDFTLERVDGGELRLSSLRGKVVLIDFWATWCGPCRRGIPHLNTLYSEYKSEGFEVLGVSVDRAQRNLTPKQLVEAFMQKVRMDYPNVLGDARVAQAYGGIQSIPTAFLIDRQGRVRNHYVGLQSPQVFERDVKKLLSEEPGESGSI